MKSQIHSKAFLVAILFFCGLGRLHAADISGNWKSEFETQVGAMKYTYQLKTEGDKITGQAIRNRDGETTTNTITEGKIKDDEISFVEQTKIQDQDIRIEYTGKVAGDEMKLTRKVGDFGTADIVAKREKETATIAIAGKWQSESDSQGGSGKYVYEFKLDGDTLTGTVTHETNDVKVTSDLKGKVTGHDITFTEDVKTPEPSIVEYSGKISVDVINLTRKAGVLTLEIVAHRLTEPPVK